MIISASATIKNNTTFPQWVLLTAPPLIFLVTALTLLGLLARVGLDHEGDGGVGYRCHFPFDGFYIGVHGRSICHQRIGRDHTNPHQQ
jgi:hypothetical protein